MIKITSNNAPFIARFGSAKHVEAIDTKYGRGVADFDLANNPMTPSHIIDSIVDNGTKHSDGRYDPAFNYAIRHDNVSKEKYNEIFNKHGLSNVQMVASKHFTPDHIDKTKMNHSIVRYIVSDVNVSKEHIDKLISPNNVGFVGSYDSISALAKNKNLQPNHITNLLQHGKIDNLDVAELIPHKSFTKEHLEMIQDRIPKSQSIRSELSRKVFE